MPVTKPLSGKRLVLYHFWVAALASLTTIALTIDLSVIPVSEIVDSSILQSVANLFFGLHLALGWSTLEPLLMWLVLFWLYGRYLNLSHGKTDNRMLSLFLALWTLFDRAMLMKDGSTKLLWANHTQIFKSLLCL